MDVRTVMITGRLGRDAEVKSYGDGKMLVSFSVGSGRGFGEKANTMWFKCTSFKKSEQTLCQNGHLNKGALVSVMGELGQDTWVNNEGVTKVTDTINVSDLVLLGSNEPRQQQAPSQPQYQQPPAQQPAGGWGGPPPQAQYGGTAQPQQQWPNQPQRPPQQPQAGGWGGAPGADDDIPF